MDNKQSCISTRQYAWRSNAADASCGAQIDLLIERADNAVNICEMKYASGEYEITKEEHGKMLHRRDLFVSEMRTRSAAYITLITIDGAVRNAYWNDLQNILTLNDLFR